MPNSQLKIYIAGPIAGTTDFVYRFGVARGEVGLMGYQPVCPLELNGVDENSRLEDSTSRRRYLINDIHALLECDGIYLLRGWEHSRGARLEKLIADGLGLIILYQDDTPQQRSDDGSSNRGETTGVQQHPT